MENRPASNVNADDLANRFRAVLDRHGYGFHYAVIRKIDQLYQKHQRWLFEVSEFPVTTDRFNTHIDFIIRPQGTRFFLAAECKRANPALNNWCFVRAPYVQRTRQHERLFVEQVVIRFAESDSVEPEFAFAEGQRLESIDNGYHIGFEVKNPTEKGDKDGTPGRHAIEEAAGQICKAVNGLAMTLARASQERFREAIGLAPRQEVVTQLMPAIFTTANLWVSDVDLGAADLLTGKIDPGTLRLKRVPWLFLQYAMSPALKHSLPTAPPGFEFAEMLDPQFMRSIAVVSAGGIEDFLLQSRLGIG